MQYSETQSLKHSPKWYLLSAVIFMIIASLLLLLFTNIQELDAVGIVTLSLIPFILIAVFMYISALELNVIIDTNNISYQLIPLFNEWAHISKRNLISYQVYEMSNVSISTKVYSKNKIRWIGKNKRFIILGNHLLELNLTDNRKIIFSTRYPEKINGIMQQLMNLKP